MAEFSFAALLEVAGAGRSVNGLARDLGLPARTLRRWRTAGVIPATSADRAAVALGHHPAEIWPHWATDAPWSTDDDD